MNIRKPSKALVLVFIAFSTPLAGCTSRQDRAQAAFYEYQAATANGDWQGARKALLALVAADDAVADYWIELGKVELQLSDYGAAYNAFARARELDRGNVFALGMLTQLALRSGNFQLAEQTARELELVAPEDPAVPLTYGYVALRRGKLDDANRHAGLLLVQWPFDPSAKVLRARILLQSGKPQEAIELLREQVRQQPADQTSLRALRSLYQLREQWPDAAWAARRLVKWRPRDQDARAQLIESELRSGRIATARSDTVAGLSEASPQEIEKLLTPWIAVDAQGQVADAVYRLASDASGERRIAFARFLAKSGRPRQVVELTQSVATLPVTASNASANALYGAAVAELGRNALGLDRLERVIVLDSANRDALRGRAELRSRAGQHSLAIEDAQKLIAVDRRSWQARLLLARLYASARDADNARRTLWEAFHDIPADRSIYGALKALVSRSEGEQAARRLEKEFNDQRTAEITRAFA